MRELASQLNASFRKFDSDFRRTFIGLALRPGAFCREYLNGKRKSYAQPIKYFFVTFAFQILLFGAIRWLSPNSEAGAAVTISQRAQMIVLCSVFFWAIAYTVLFRKSHHNLAENAVCMLFLSGQTRIYAVILQLLLLPLAQITTESRTITGLALMVLDVSYYSFFSKQHFGESWPMTILKNLLVVIAFVFLFLPVLYADVLVNALIQAWQTGALE
jgi:hypothetical protein